MGTLALSHQVPENALGLEFPGRGGFLWLVLVALNGGGQHQETELTGCPDRVLTTEEALWSPFRGSPRHFSHCLHEDDEPEESMGLGTC